VKLILSFVAFIFKWWFTLSRGGKVGWPVVFLVKPRLCFKELFNKKKIFTTAVMDNYCRKSCLLNLKYNISWPHPLQTTSYQQIKIQKV